MTAQEAAQGFIAVAVASMANAIKRISVQKGHDVTQYALTTFGGGLSWSPLERLQLIGQRDPAELHAKPGNQRDQVEQEDELAAAIRHVHDGDAVVAPSTTRRLIEHVTSGRPSSDRAGHTDSRLERLTPREREVLQLIARGLSNAEIAAEFVISEGTVKVHVGRILHKLGLRDRVQAVVLAYETGLVRPS